MKTKNVCEQGQDISNTGGYIALKIKQATTI